MMWTLQRCPYWRGILNDCTCIYIFKYLGHIPHNTNGLLLYNALYRSTPLVYCTEVNHWYYVEMWQHIIIIHVKDPLPSLITSGEDVHILTYPNRNNSLCEFVHISEVVSRIS